MADHSCPQAPATGIREISRYATRPQALSAAGLCGRRRHARCSVPAAWRQPACCASAQSKPTKAATASEACGCMCDLPRVWDTGVPRAMPGCALRRHEREPVRRQTLRRRSYVRTQWVLRLAYASSAGAGSCVPCQLPARCGPYH
jgi:hypothetical protein